MNQDISYYVLEQSNDH